MRGKFGLKLREEIHAGQMLSRPGDLVRIKRNDRLTIIRHFLDELAELGYVSFIDVRIDKTGKPPAYDPAKPSFDPAQQQNESHAHLLARNRWQLERKNTFLIHDGFDAP